MVTKTAKGMAAAVASHPPPPCTHTGTKACMHVHTTFLRIFLEHVNRGPGAGDKDLRVPGTGRVSGVWGISGSLSRRAEEKGLGEGLESWNNGENLIQEERVGVGNQGRKISKREAFGASLVLEKEKASTRVDLL